MKCHVHLNSIHFSWCDILSPLHHIIPSLRSVKRVDLKSLVLYSTSKPYIYFILKDEGKGGVCNPGGVEFLGSGHCFDAPSYILYLFVVNVENKIHMVNITCWLQLKYKHNLLIIHESNIWSGSRSVGHGHIVNELM